ncbi:MAG: proline--tRNA ligase [Victivallaceae bacterium]|nr:proline--tRNA ligase [Victivallaceae bacterium]MDD4316899.1 proline--tRNA ligase [Victivallaceae bacterium]MDD5662713.1 proline--tRNA ligase [Victivallaceae bacterium]
MRMSKLVGRRLKEEPRDAKTASHKFLLRGGYIRMVSTGIYSLLPLGQRITAKIEQIIREEMDAIDGQEVLMPVVLPAELWHESGRYDTVGPELLRFVDRNEKPMMLGMTHEEAVVHMARTELTSYKQLPVMIYQIQTKYRDEARARGGLIRCREFTMKDAYSFHVSQEDLEKYYERAYRAYEKIFTRLGMNNVVSIEANSGMMGGKVSHEFIAVADCGEDTIILAEDGSYRANREVATAAWKFEKSPELPLEKVLTPGQKTIDEVAGFLGVNPENTGKAVFYQNVQTGQLIFALIRGDFEVNEVKLQNIVKAVELKFADDEAIRAAGCEPGYASPLKIDPRKVLMVIDRSVVESSNLVVGANEPDYHYRNFNFKRDAAYDEIIEADIATVRDGDPAPSTGSPLRISRGIEVGNIFQLGTRYSAAMNCNYLDQNGKSSSMVMGCYGIGVGRAMASVIEQNYDDYGPIWPITIAPYQIHLCALDLKKEGVANVSEQLYQDFLSAGIEVLFDDRGEKAGFMFSDADLIGIPLRVTVGARSLAEGKVEIKRRGEKDSQLIDVNDAVNQITKLVSAEFAKYQV